MGLQVFSEITDVEIFSYWHKVLCRFSKNWEPTHCSATKLSMAFYIFLLHLNFHIIEVSAKKTPLSNWIENYSLNKATSHCASHGILWQWEETIISSLKTVATIQHQIYHFQFSFLKVGPYWKLYFSWKEVPNIKRHAVVVFGCRYYF